MDYNYDDTALILATYYGYIEVVKILIDAGVDFNIRNDNGCTALDFSLEKEHHDIVALIKFHIEKQTERQKYVFDLNI